MNNSLCETCEHCMCYTVENTPGGSGNKTRVICLINTDAYHNFVAGMYKNTEPYPAIISCTQYQKRRKEKA